MNRQSSMFKPRLDAGGARLRQQRAEAHRLEVQKNQDANRQRIAKAAGRIPVLSSIKQVVAHATEVEGVMSRSRTLSFPVLQISKKLDLGEVFKALPQNLGNTPNVTAERRDQTSVGAHFDAYYGNFSPWTIHENVEGEGIIRAAFLPSAQFAGYLKLKESFPDTEEADTALAELRSTIGRLALAESKQVYVGKMGPGTRTLIWHGMPHYRNIGIPPAVHDIQRSEPGAYRIYAHQHRGELGAGFTAIAR